MVEFKKDKFVVILICRLIFWGLWFLLFEKKEDKFMCLRIVVVGDVNIM